MDHLSSHGVTIGVPTGWEAELSTQEDPAAIDTALRFSKSVQVVVHAANFSLPADRGDYGSGAVEIMGPSNIFVSILEFDAASASSQLFSDEGIPATLHPDDFTTDQLQRPQRGQGGIQRFFHVGSRAFCLYVVIGSHGMRNVLVPEVNSILAELSIG